MTRVLLLALAFVMTPVAALASDAPEWTKNEMKQLFGQAQASTRAPNVQEKDRALLMMGAQAYRVPPKGNESTERYAERILKKRVPEHPMVKGGQWLTALLRQFYADASARAAHLSRFELDRNDRRFFEQMSAEAKTVSDTLGRHVQFVVEGLDGATEPLPRVGGDAPTKTGALVLIKDGGVVIENMKRATFVNDQPKDDAPRTAKGALKELYSAQKQYNVQSQMFGQYDRAWRKNGGHVRAVVPAKRPAIYLNEIVRAAIPAGMHTLHLMTMSKSGELRQIDLAIGAPKKKRKKRRRRRKKKGRKTLVDISCADELLMELCAQRIVHAGTRGTPRYVP